jgi:hypothetical protein
LLMSGSCLEIIQLLSGETYGSGLMVDGGWRSSQVVTGIGGAHGWQRAHGKALALR